MKILVISATFPSVADTFRGVFVKERLKSLAAVPSVDEIRVIAPVPWFPRIKRFAKWYTWSQYPKQENVEGLITYHPRYPLPPAIGGYWHSELMYPSVCRLAEKLRKEFKFDLIDSHFVYPSGVVAARLGKHFHLPVTMTGRGEDMMKFPDQPIVGNRIRFALGASSQCIGVSREIADKMIKNGADPRHTHVLANGVDSQKFHRLDLSECRLQLNLPSDKKILLSVGEMIELKGFHLLVEAMPAILRVHPDAMLYIVGRTGRFGRDCTEDLNTRINALGIKQNVILTGAVAHDRLKLWFNAANLFALMSSREGSPNVLLEALACGVPSVATGVGGIPDELADPCLGQVISERSSVAAAKAIIAALGRPWDRDAISKHMENRSWKSVAQRFHEILELAVRSHGNRP
jgi:teichuronic acid biosynthesis glycosyltransferase TuaC